jgi:hypothetical protein
MGNIDTGEETNPTLDEQQNYNNTDTGNAVNIGAASKFNLWGSLILLVILVIIFHF